MSERDILVEVQKAIRDELHRYANAEIGKLEKKFRSDMGQFKNELIGGLINAIDISTRNDIAEDKIIVQITIRK